MKKILVICESKYNDLIEYDIHFIVDILSKFKNIKVYLIDSGTPGQASQNVFKKINNISKSNTIFFKSPSLNFNPFYRLFIPRRILIFFKRQYFLVKVIKNIKPDRIISYSGARYALASILVMLNKNIRNIFYYRLIDKFSIIFDSSIFTKKVISALELTLYLLSKKLLIISNAYMNEYKFFHSYLKLKTVLIRFPLPKKYIHLSKKKNNHNSLNKMLLDTKKSIKDKVRLYDFESAITLRNDFELLQKLKKQPDKLNLCFVGVLYNFSGILEFIKIAHENKNFFKKFNLFIFGDGAIKQEITEFINRNNLQDSVIFMGWINPESLSKYLIYFDIGLNTMSTGRFKNIFNAKIVQYIANGNMVVSLDRRGAYSDFPKGISGVIYFKNLNSMINGLLKINNNDITLLKKNAVNHFDNVFSVVSIKNKLIDSLEL